MKLTLHRKSGNQQSWTFEPGEAITLGRMADNRVHLDDVRISRFHAKLYFQEDQWFLVELESVNGTYINGVKRAGPIPLRNGDLVQLGQTPLLVVLSQPDGTQKTAPVGCPRMQPGTEAWFSTLRAQLAQNHVILFNTAENGLHDALTDPTSEFSRQIAGGFHRYVVLDGQAGSAEHGRFSFQGFLENTRRQLIEAFEIPQTVLGSHPEDVAQVLKDESRSLFCFANFDVIPVAVFGFLRGFTQNEHRVLVLCKGYRHLEQEESNQDDSVIRLVFTPRSWFMLDSRGQGTG